MHDGRTPNGTSVSPDRASDGAVRWIADRITSGEFAPGAKLPAQRHLASTLNVSRTTLREAMSILEALKIIRTEPVRGSFVIQQPAGQPSAEERLGLTPSSPGYSALDVYQYRYVIEPAFAMQAATRATEASLAALRASIDEQKAAFSAEDMDRAARSDFEFHDIILEMAGNRLILDMQSTCRRVVSDSHSAPLRRRDRLWESVVEHERIMSAIIQRDPEGAHYFMRYHIIRAADRFGITINGVA
jgi:GntR family transcriptional regulator, transcriptional repressor for pyruvate dehydrogenase complex